MALTAAMAPSTAAVAAALSALASCNLKELHLRRGDGSRMLDSLHATCRAAGLIPPGAPHATPKDRYIAVFDVALQSCLGCWILDYVEVVCADRHLTSNDPLEAYLLDGGFVKAWAQGCLQRAEQAATEALRTDAAFHTFQATSFQTQLSQIRVLVAVLRALDRIRAGAGGLTAAVAAPATAFAPGGMALLPGMAGSAAGAAAAGGAAAGQDRMSVKAELRQAVLLEQAFEVMDWVARQGLAARSGAGTAGGGGGSSCAGRHASYAEWCRALSGRRARAAPRALFLDSLLESLSLGGAYPASALHQMLHTLLLVVRDVEAPAWAAKLALLSYFLLDGGLLTSDAAAAAPAASGAGAGPGPARWEAAAEDLRSTFRLSAAEVGTWQCQWLLDCAAPGRAYDPHLARACALLPSCVTASTPFAFTEALLALGRPDVALAVDHAQGGAEAAAATAAAGAAGGGGSAGRRAVSLAQAQTRLEIRLRCGLMTEAFMLMRQHAADLAASGAPPPELREHSGALLLRLAGWAAERGGGGEPWLARLSELPLNATEEAALVPWLLAEAEAGRPAGDLLPLFFLQRGRVAEATAAWRRWGARQEALAAAGCRRSPAGPLLEAALDAAHAGGLAGPAANAAVPGDPGAPPPEVPGQGAVGILAGLVDHSSPEVPLAELPLHGTAPPPLLGRVVQLPPPYSAGGGGGAAGRVAADGGGGAAMGDAAEEMEGTAQPAQQSHAPFAAGPAPFLLGAAPALPGAAGAGMGMGGGGGLLFSVGPAALGTAGGGASRSYKRPKPNDWLLG